MSNKETIMNYSKDEVILEKHVEQSLKENYKTFDMQMEVHYAHVIMLYQQGIITHGEAKDLLESLLKVSEEGSSIIPLKPQLTDLYSNLEEWLISEIGPEIGGKLHIGRSRNDMDLTIDRMYTRASLISLSKALFSLMEGLLEEAEKHIETIIPGYTHHSQHAQPTTLGHFFITFFNIFQRDLDRLYDSYFYANICPMGGAALAGTGFDIDRPMVAELLGFSQSIESTMDASASLDFQYGAAATMAIFVNNIGRMIESLLLWHIREVDLVRLDIKYCSYSTIMPQKRNPVALETLRYTGEWVYGSLSTMFNTLKAFTQGNGREPGFVTSIYMEIVDKVEDSTYLLDGIIRSLEVDRNRGLQLAKEGFSTTTELADELVRSKGLSFVMAKKLVGGLVLLAQEEGRTCEEIDSELLNRASSQILARDINMSDNEIKKALDPIENIKRRNTLGGPAFEEVARMIKSGYITLDKVKKKWQDEEDRLKVQSETLREKVYNLVGK